MSKGPEFELPDNQSQQPSEPDFKIEDLASARLTKEHSSQAAGDYFFSQAVDLSEGKIKIENGSIQIDKKAWDEEREDVLNWLQQSIEQGNERTLQIFLRSIDDRDQGAQDLRARLIDAFAQKDASRLQLSELHINLPAGSIAERNIIREAIKPQLNYLPFTFRDEQGNTLNQNDLDIMFVKGPKGEFKFIVGSKKGIDSIGIPEETAHDKFHADFMNVEKNQATGAILIPLKSADDGTDPLVGIIEVRKGRVDISSLTEEEEKQEQSQPRQSGRKSQSSSSSYSQPTYTPPSPVRYSGESRSVSTSG